MNLFGSEMTPPISDFFQKKTSILEAWVTPQWSRKTRTQARTSQQTSDDMMHYSFLFMEATLNADARHADFCSNYFLALLAVVFID